MPGTNPYQQQAQVAKAHKLMEHLWTRGHRSGDVERMHAHVRESHARLLGMPHASDETWGIVSRLMQVREREQAVEDPFAGL